MSNNDRLQTITEIWEAIGKRQGFDTSVTVSGPDNAGWYMLFSRTNKSNDYSVAAAGSYSYVLGYLTGRLDAGGRHG